MDDIQPTARWANRMLRPLTSIYRRLEKHQETLAIIAAESRTQIQNETIDTYAPSVTEAVSARDNYSGSDADEDDPVWVPGKKPEQRRIRHKYSGRGEGKGGKKRTRLSVHSPEAPRTLPGAIELATPLITGRRWEAPSSARLQLSIEQSKSMHPQGHLQAFRDRYPLYKSPWQELLDHTGDSGFADIAHNLNRVLQNFLCNTRIPWREEASGVLSKPGLGARSLVSMVARRLPEFIASEQEAQDEMDKDGDEDMCDAYFTELESFYAPHGKGWRPLREAVRAQGIYLVSTMIQNKWVTDAIAGALIENCRWPEPDAGASLLSTFLSTCTAYPYPLSVKPPAARSAPGDPVRLLRKYAYLGITGRSHIFDELSKLLIRGVLPPEWMATKSWTSWMTRATVSFSAGDEHCAAASRLIEAVLVSACSLRPTTNSPKPKRGRPTKRSAARGRATRASSVAPTNVPDIPRLCPAPVEDALSNHVMSLMAALCGMHISRSRELDGIDGLDGTKAGHIINYLSFTFERNRESAPLSHITTFTSHALLRRGCILLADCLLQCNDAIIIRDSQYKVVSTPKLEGYCEALASRSDLVKDLALFLRQAFRCFGGATDGEPLYMGQEVRRMLSRLPHLADAPGLLTLLSRVAVEAAMEFAEATGEPDDHLWAVEIQEMVIALQRRKESSPESTKDPEEQGQRRGYRWEESIGEWVARTPAVKVNPMSALWDRGRAWETAVPMPFTPRSISSATTDEDGSEPSTSSLTSSPQSAGTKRNLEVEDSSPLRPMKRQRSARVFVIDNSDRRRCGSMLASTGSRSPSLEPVPSHRRILREMSNHNMTNPVAPAAAKRAPKIEVVVINKKDSHGRGDSTRSPSESPQKQIHRARERRRPGRPRTSDLPTTAPRALSRQKSIIPCSEDDSDDELSFM